MLRRSRYLAFENRRDAYRRNARRQSLLWDKEGNFLLWNAVRYYYAEVGQPVKYTLLFIALLVGYTKVVVWFEKRSQKSVRESEQQRLDYLHHTGKVKSERFVVINSRTIDDPDFNNIPAYAGKNTPWKTKLYEEDKFSVGYDAGDEPRFRGGDRVELDKKGIYSPRSPTTVTSPPPADVRATSIPPEPSRPSAVE